VAEPPAEPVGRALVAHAVSRLVDAGVKPTQAAVAEALEVSDRTVRRWMSA
jgi:hypothetical protein